MFVISGGRPSPKRKLICFLTVDNKISVRFNGLSLFPMVPLSDIQVAAVQEAKRLLDEVGLSETRSLQGIDTQYVARTISDHLPSAIQGYSCNPGPVRRYTPEECSQHVNQVNRQSCIQAIADHPPGAIVEYPETDAADNIGHRFLVLPEDFSHPKLNIQYSLGDTHGTRQNVKCRLLLDINTGAPVLCKNEKTSCLLFHSLFFKFL